MTIIVVGKKITKYRTVCTDNSCLNILEFDSTDIRLVSINSMGRNAGSERGISCPSCAQILIPENFEEIG